MKGRLAVRSACSRVPSSRIDAQLISFLASCSTLCLPAPVRRSLNANGAARATHLHLRGILALATRAYRPDARIYSAVQARGRESMP